MFDDVELHGTIVDVPNELRTARSLCTFARTTLIAIQIGFPDGAMNIGISETARQRIPASHATAGVACNRILGMLLHGFSVSDRLLAKKKPILRRDEVAVLGKEWQRYDQKK